MCNDLQNHYSEMIRSTLLQGLHFQYTNIPEARCCHNGRRLALLNKEGCNKSPPERKEEGVIMMMDYITLARFEKSTRIPTLVVLEK